MITLLCFLPFVFGKKCLLLRLKLSLLLLLIFQPSLFKKAGLVFSLKP